MNGAEGWLSTDGAVPVEDVVYAATHAVQEGLLRAAQQLGTRMTEAQRRRALRDHLADVRATLERLLLLVRWAADSHPTALALSSALSSSLEQQDAMRRVADDLFHMHRAMPLAVAPPPDVFAAVDMLSTGSYSQLPQSIRAPVAEEPPGRIETSGALRWLRAELRKKRSHWRLPDGVSVEPLRGALRCFAEGEYELAMTAEGSGGATAWKLIRLRLLTAASSRSSPDHGAATPAQWRRLWRDAETTLSRRPRQPLLLLHPPLHAACAQLGLVRLRAQAASLSRGAWAGRLACTAKLNASGGVASLTLEYAFSPAHPFGTSGGGMEAALGRSSLTVRPAPSRGLEVSHTPPIAKREAAWSANSPWPGSSGAISVAAPGMPLEEWEALSLEGLSAEAVLQSAIRDRSAVSLEALRRKLIPEGDPAPATRWDHSNTAGGANHNATGGGSCRSYADGAVAAPAGGDGAGGFAYGAYGATKANLAADEPMPLLRISLDLALVHRPGTRFATPSPAISIYMCCVCVYMFICIYICIYICVCVCV